MTELTYRFKVNSELSCAIKNFSLKHKLSSRSEFKKSYELWKIENEKLYCLEKERLINLGYVGDFDDKIYKSARYYYRNTKHSKETQLSDTKQKSQTKYITRNLKFLGFIENYIDKHNIKQSMLYKQFISETDNMGEIEKEITRLKTFQLSNDECSEKIKKMFNNVYYKVKSKKHTLNNRRYDL